MQLNLPILDHIKDSQNILISGAGGGFDIFCGLPIYSALREMGKNVHLGNYSFCDIPISRRLISDSDELLPDLVLGVRGHVEIPINFFAEGYLAQWFSQEYGEEVTIWMMAKTGAAPLAQGYARLVEHLNIDAIILVDGGVDSLMRGDEESPGTLVEDSISLAAVDTVDVPVKLLACIGFGTEIEEHLCHHHALENMARLTGEGAYMGSCALTLQMECFRLFEEACRYVWEQPDHGKSHISTRIVPAVHGEFGNYHMYLPRAGTPTILVSPLMSIYWFFDATTVIRDSLVVPLLPETETTTDAFAAYFRYRRELHIRPRKRIPY